MERQGCLMASTALLCCRQCRKDESSFTCRPLRHEDEDEEDPVLWTEADPSSSHYTDGGDDAPHIHGHRRCPCEGGGEALGSVITASTGFHILRTLDEDEDGDGDGEYPHVWRRHIYPYCELTDSYDGHHPCAYAHRSEENGCACLYKPSDSCEGVTTEPWQCSPFPCLGVSKTLLVGVEVDIVEELEFEDTEVLEELVEPDVLSHDILMESTLTHEDQLLL